ncbi:outer membrane protein [Bradyrhizobium sp.]|uniref:outer membrane protein n=1 Tax=Bradyrhizobium sp. TaxID=376 RepID=UPI002D27D60E|nr:outer membrane protein [Bradyrhizobium sp.]HZR76010.1 outer membrane protein [Bradyrhizobium sp.]
MKRLLIGIAAAASLIAGGAFAADLPAKAPVYTKAPAYVEPIYDWTGFYIGGNVGYSWGRSSDATTVTSPAGAVLFSATDRTDLNGIVGGGQIGYNWQMQNWVFGLEADIQGTDEKGTHDYLCATTCIPSRFGALPIPAVSVSEALSQKIDWFGTVRGRIGVLAAPRVLLYATGGLAYGEVASSATIAPTVTGVSAVIPGVNSTNVGWTLGVGVEGVIAPNWTAKLEYLYVDLGTVSGSFATTVAGTNLVSNFSSRVTDNVLRAGINYKFGGPVVARY